MQKNELTLPCYKRYQVYPDDELTAINAMIEIFNGMQTHEINRVVRYLNDRYAKENV